MENDFLSFLKKNSHNVPTSSKKLQSKTPKSSAKRLEKDSFKKEIESAFDHFRVDQLQEDIRQKELEDTMRKTFLMNNEENMYLEFYRHLLREFKPSDYDESSKELIKKIAELKCKNEHLQNEKDEAKESLKSISMEVETLKKKKMAIQREIKEFEGESLHYEKRIGKMKESLKDSEEMYKVAAKIVKDNVVELEQRGISKVTKANNKRKMQ